jgi:CTD kinase subunit beta
MAGYAIRYPELAAKSKALGGEVEMDPAVRLHLHQYLPCIEYQTDGCK